MAMNSLVSLISSSVAIVLVALLFLLSTSYCLIHNQGLVVAEKTRLGSTPPSCHNKCNLCHPCMAVQVPTLPSHNGVQPAAASTLAHPQSYFESSPSSGGNRYSNYKPLGWKCRCDGHFYNP